MLIASAQKAIGEILDPKLRQVFWKTLGLTILALIIIWNLTTVGLETFAVPFVSDWFASLSLPSWTGTMGLFAAIIAGLGLAVGLTFLIGPVSAVIAGLFLDDVAEHVEKQDYPNDKPGTAMPLGRSIIMSLKFFGIVILGNLLALMLLLVPGVNLIAFFAINGYLLGREYFEFAALRHHDAATVRMLRSRYSGTIIMGGLMIAGFLAIPIVNLMTPLFGAALMVHLHKAIASKAERTS
ncbi:sulfate transporter family protein [Ahrensia sp. 13_GOM-1096m]|uniref:sulfate transporter family protein n=1 Tax=Ahrensia sp. 13_GOM-1096m TaxID=1380380 RepID=UPI00047DD92A|nr:sulfate transporter family protein [Ahrensia sp. 13_GOM-1096m]